MRKIAMTWCGLMVAAAGAQAAPGSLRMQAEAFAGRPVLLDPRVPVPACSGGIDVAWRDAAARALVATCLETGWRMVIPVSGGTSASTEAAIARRGDPVIVRIAGYGFSIGMEAVAEGDAKPGGRVMVRNTRTGERLAANVSPDGRLWLAGQGRQP